MPEDKKTEFAMAAMSLAEVFQVNFGSEQLVAAAQAGGAAQAKEPIYRMEIAAPEGPSTGGGKQAVQPIKLVPEEGATIVIGSVNQVEKTAELRTFDYLAEAHAQRFKGARIPLRDDKYNDVLRRMQAFFSNYGFRLVMSDASKLPAGKPAESKSSAATIVGALALLAAIAAAGYFLLVHK
jgi:hypothetical protein